MLKNANNFISIYIYCWKISLDFKSCGELTSYGVLPYDNEKNSIMNEKVESELTNLNFKSKTIKTQILSTIQPFSYQFSGKILF